MRRTRHLLVAVAVVASGAAVVVTAPASAFMTETFTIEQGGANEATFGPIPGQYPGTTAAVPTPSGCGNEANTAPFQTQCDRVPIKIVPPPLAGNEDFIVSITVTWEPKEDVDGNYVNDLDIYLWDNQQIGRRTNPDSTTWTRLGASTTAAMPETVKLFSPMLGDYNMTVVNWSGPNINYTLTAKMSVEGFESPFEDLGPRFGGSTGPSGDAPKDTSGDEFSGPVDFSAIEDDPGAVGAGGDTFQAIPEVPVLPDDDFAGFGASTFDRELSGGPPQGAMPIARRGVTAPGPVSVPLLLFWLVVVPLALVAALVVVALRKNRTAFVFAPA